MASSREDSDLGLEPKEIIQHPIPTSPRSNMDAEKQQRSQEPMEQKKSVYAGLGWLDRLLVVWILLAIIVGILLGNFVAGVGPALQKGKFVDVSVPIGKKTSYRK